MLMHTHTHTGSYTPLLVLSRRAVSPYAARPLVRGTGSHNGLRILSCRYRGKNPENMTEFQREYLKILFYNIINLYILIISQETIKLVKK